MLKLQTVVSCAIVTLAVLLSANKVLGDEPATQRGSSPTQATRVEFTAFDQTRQAYYEYAPKPLDPTRPLMLFIALHGHGSNADQIFSGAYAEFNATPAAAADNNGIVIAPEYRPTTSWMGPEAEKDVLQIIEEQKSKRKFAIVVISGGSMGGSSALTFTALHPELIDGVVAMNPTANHLEYDKFQDAISESFGGTKQEIPLEYKARSAEYFPERFLNVPTAITLGSKDVVVPPDSARRFAAVLEKIGGKVLCIERSDLDHTTQYPEARRAFQFVVDAISQARAQ